MLASLTGESGNSRWADIAGGSSLLGQPYCRWVLQNTSETSRVSIVRYAWLQANKQKITGAVAQWTREGGNIPDEA